MSISWKPCQPISDQYILFGHVHPCNTLTFPTFIAWVFGKLGSGVRRQLPSCVVDDIRRNFPAPDNVYVPFCDTDS